MKWILASESPRRRELLAQLGICFECLAPAIDEQLDLNDIDASLRELAQQKALTARRSFSEGISIGSDTTVVLNGQCLGKPRDHADAMQMLRSLSGSTHVVKTAVALLDLKTNVRLVGLEETAVSFRLLDAGEIERYLNESQPFDKAGAYGIQEHGGLFVKNISGCYTNIIGFPVPLFLELKQAMEVTLA